MLYTDEGMRDNNNFLYKIICLSSILLERSEIGCEREREREIDAKDSDFDWWRTAILTLFLIHVVILYSGPYILFLWQEVLHQALPDPTTLVLADCLLTVWIPSAWQTDRCVCGYLCINNFIMLTHSFHLSFQLSSHMTCFHCSLVYTAETSCLEILTWRVCQRSYYIWVLSK